MLDQSFSAENFRTILDIENRKGIDLGSQFFPDVLEITQKIKKINADLKTARRIQDKLMRAVEIKKVLQEKEKLIEEKEKLLSEKLIRVSEEILSSRFKFELQKNDDFGDKPIYTIEKEPSVYFSLKQTQYNFRKLYKVKQADRFQIVSQVKTLICDGFPKVVLRTDIENFYESIPHKNLLDKLNEENLLSFYSKRIITKILNDYKLKSGSNVGIPRGIGISAYLVELYLRDFDKEIKELLNVNYYARYVDDIIIFFIPPITNIQRDYISEIDTIISKYGLKRNHSKTKLIASIPSTNNQQHSFEYLGYEMAFGYTQKDPSPPKIMISKKKVNRYKERIIFALEHYINYSKINEKDARKMLIKRIRFLTNNTRLINNKRNITTGIFSSNSLINTTGNLKDLDNYLSGQVQKYRLNQPVQQRIGKYSFEKGFLEKRYTKFTSNDLSMIMKIWKNR
ncbi:antiviral reverse transcriptase Drt3a [Chitinophaga barathri]|uniref:RNA-directed DNA polymerase n=1 Tax=Chitinophaga barathri TaxID=1647451 RepID=A0A3N4MAB2_9BACT|nr:antiviral reverse transcriptase Drt3a [Chitinophaga barathri]RPD40704.1 RNA-directed DNA polymerase [Chitinophaga barathri]